MVARTRNGWKVREHPGKGTFVAPNGKTVYCADDDVAEIFRYIVEQWHERIEPLDKATYNQYPNERRGHIVVHCSRPKPLNGLLDSNHLSQTAMDIMGHKHHYERSCSMANGNSCWGDGKPHKYISGFTTQQLSELEKIGKEVDSTAGRWMIRIGAIHFAPGWRDAMHVELAPGVTNADVARAAQALRALRTVESLSDELVNTLEFLGYPGSVEGVRAFQKDHGLDVDGIVGPLTNTRLEIEVAKVADEIVEKVNSHTDRLRRERTNAHVKEMAALKSIGDAVGSPVQIDVKALLAELIPEINEAIRDAVSDGSAEAIIDALADRLNKEG